MAVDVDPDFAQEVVEDLYRYRHKRVRTARLWLIFTGLLGGHMFYLGKPLRGIAYFLTAGGVLVLWLIDFRKIGALVEQYNQLEDECQAAGIAPQALSFLPPIDEINLEAAPVWSEKRSKRSVLVGGSALIALIGFVMGIISGSTGVYEPAVIMVVLMVVTLLSARWQGMYQLPLFAQLSRWNHRLRLYYFTTDPGSVWLLASRPYIGPLLAPWSQQARAEVRLYLQIGIAFAVLFAAFDIYEMVERGFWVGLGLMFAELGQTVVYTYVFIAPVGAILITQQLLARKDGVIAIMCLVNLGCGYLGLWLVGAV